MVDLTEAEGAAGPVVNLGGQMGNGKWSQEDTLRFISLAIQNAGLMTTLSNRAWGQRLGELWVASGGKRHKTMGRRLDQLVTDRLGERANGLLEGTGTEHSSELNQRLDYFADEY